MSEKYQLLRSEMITAMKAGNRTRKDGISLIVNEVNVIAKGDGNREPTDADVIQALNRTIKKAAETREILIGRNEDVSAQDAEIALAREFLPQQMTSEALEAKIADILEKTDRSKAARGIVMKALNEDHKGEFDPKIANEIVGRLLG